MPSSKPTLNSSNNSKYAGYFSDTHWELSLDRLITSTKLPPKKKSALSSCNKSESKSSLYSKFDSKIEDYLEVENIGQIQQQIKINTHIRKSGLPIQLIEKYQLEKLEKSLANDYDNYEFEEAEGNWNGNKVHFLNYNMNLAPPKQPKSIGIIRLQEKARKIKTKSRNDNARLPCLSSSILELRTTKTPKTHLKLPLIPMNSFSVSSFQDEGLTISQSDFLKVQILNKIKQRANDPKTPKAPKTPMIKRSVKYMDSIKSAPSMRPSTYHHSFDQESFEKLSVKRSISTSEGLLRKINNDQDDVSAWL